MPIVVGYWQAVETDGGKPFETTHLIDEASRKAFERRPIDWVPPEETGAFVEEHFHNLKGSDGWRRALAGLSSPPTDKPWSPPVNDYPPLPSRLEEQLARIERSTDHSVAYAPCRVTMVSGAVHDRVCIAEAESYLRRWGSHPSDLISIDEVATIDASPARLPAGLANELYEAGESGMGYYVFTVVMRDGSRLPFQTGDALDFPDWPPGTTGLDAIGVIPHEGREHFQGRDTGTGRRDASVSWCLYSLPGQ